MSIATKLAKLKTIKQDIKSALEEKGQTPSNVFSTYANNIRAIETGGGSDLDSFIDGSITELTSNAISIRNYAFYFYSNLISANLPNATSLGKYAFYNCSKLTFVNLPNAQFIYDQAFNGCENLTNVNLPNVQKTNYRAFYNCSKLTSIYLPNITDMISGTFSGCSNLTSANLHNVKYIESYVFQNCYSLIEVLIEQTNSVCNLSSAYVFNGCYHILGTTNSTWNPNGLKDGYIYVPASLLSQYKVATNWTKHASQIVGHQDYVVGDELVNYSNETYTTCIWYSDKEMTIEVASVESDGRYYCKLD